MSLDLTDTSQSCAECGSFGKDAGDPLVALGFGHCRHDIPARYRSPVHPCGFVPSRFVERRRPPSLGEALRAHRAQRGAA